MKKIILAATFIMVSTLVGMAQNTEKVLKMGKWYANAELGSKTITLSKTIPAKWEFDIELTSEGVMNYGQIAKVDFITNGGDKVNAGAYYADTQYSYKVNGNTIQITYQPTVWNYNVKSLQNGDLLLEAVQSTNKGNTK